MADINQVITLGIGDPSDIEHFILVGLNVAPAAAAEPQNIDITGIYAPTLSVTGTYAPAITLTGRTEID